MPILFSFNMYNYILSKVITGFNTEFNVSPTPNKRIISEILNIFYDQRLKKPYIVLAQ